jgi:hypothetical protein
MAQLSTGSAASFWQAACSPRFFTTDIHGGQTRQFVIDLATLGLPNTDRGLCLNQWFFDDVTGTAIALGGVPIPSGHGMVQFVFAITRTSERLNIGVIDLVENRWSHWLATNARYDTFRVTPESGVNMGVVPGNTFFFSVVYTPCEGRGRPCR